MKDKDIIFCVAEQNIKSLTKGKYWAGMRFLHHSINIRRERNSYDTLKNTGVKDFIASQTAIQGESYFEQHKTLGNMTPMSHS